MLLKEKATPPSFIYTYNIYTHNMIHPLILVAVFVVCTLVGYFIINKVPSLLHTPLMSGMNALSGVTLVGALTATGFALMGNGSETMLVVSQVIGCLAIILAAINVFGGFDITNRMLQMFNKKKK